MKLDINHYLDKTVFITKVFLKLKKNIYLRTKIPRTEVTWIKVEAPT